MEIPLRMNRVPCVSDRLQMVQESTGPNGSRVSRNSRLLGTRSYSHWNYRIQVGLRVLFDPFTAH
jgi:hypothetical protein